MFKRTRDLWLWGQENIMFKWVQEIKTKKRELIRSTFGRQRDTTRFFFFLTYWSRLVHFGRKNTQINKPFLIFDLGVVFCDSMSDPKVTTSKQYTQTKIEKKKKKRKERQPLCMHWLPIIRLKVRNNYEV